MTTYDVVVIGEPLVELASPTALRDAAQLRLSFSGDALNAAAAAAAAGADVGLLARVADDQLGEALIAHVARLGVDTALLRRVPGQMGVYFVVDDPAGAREFTYVREGSAASRLGPGDIDPALIAACRVLMVGGIAQAISESSAAAVQRAAQIAHAAGVQVVYDPNYRLHLTSPERARAALARVAPLASLVTPSAPGETAALLGEVDPAAAAFACLRLGAAAAAVTCGADGVVVDAGGGPVPIPAAPVPGAIVDATGAGDAFAGTAAALLAQGADPVEAARGGAIAAALAMTASGGTGHHSPAPRTRDVA